MQTLSVNGSLATQELLLLQTLRTGIATGLGPSMSIGGGGLLGVTLRGGSLGTTRSGDEMLTGTINDFYLNQISLNPLTFTRLLEVDVPRFSADGLYTVSARGTDTVRGTLNFDYLEDQLSAEDWRVNGSDENDSIATSTLFSFAGDDLFTGNGGNDFINGGAGTDTAKYAGTKASYTLVDTRGSTVLVEGGTDGRDTLINIEFLEFSDGTFAIDDVVRNRYIDEAELVSGNAATVFAELRDFDGNYLGTPEGWKLLGAADVQNDGDIEKVYVNPTLGRWATLGPDSSGVIDLDGYGAGGDTRVVGVYLDPLVEAGVVQKGSDVDSARRFANDLTIDNLVFLDGSDEDYDGDGLQQVYFKTNDGTAYLHALMHADGNIQYANYQSEAQMVDYLTDQGYDTATYGDWLLV